MNEPPLPQPVARLLECARCSKSDSARFHAVWGAWELSLRLAVAARGATPLEALSGATPAQWAAAFDPFDERPLAGEGCRRLIAVHARRAGRPAGAGGAVDPDALVHAATALVVRARTATTALSEETSALEDALAEAWAAGTFLPRPHLLLWVHGGRLFDLGGPTVRGPLDLAPAGAASLPPGLHLFAARRWTALAPALVAFAAESPSPAPIVHLFDRLAGARGARYVDPDGGGVLDAEDLRAPEALFPGPAELEAVERLGLGARGAVHVARDPRSGRHVALRAEPVRLRGGRPRQETRLSEVRALAPHANVVRVLGAVQVDGRPGYAMELVPGIPLAHLAAELVARDGLRAAVRRAVGALHVRSPAASAWVPAANADGRAAAQSRPWADVARALADWARGLASVHAGGVAHRAVRATNAYLTWPALVGVLAEPAMEAVASEPVARSAPWRWLGARGLGVVDEQRADVRALAALGLDLVRAQAAPAHVPGVAPPPSAPRPAPPELVALLVKAAEASPRRGFRDAAELAAALDAFARAPAPPGPARAVAEPRTTR